MKEVKELIKAKTESLIAEKEKKLEEIKEIENSLEETNKIDELTNDKDIFSKLTPVESMDIIKKLGVETEVDQREVVLNLINESLKTRNMKPIEITPIEEKQEGIEKMSQGEEAEDLTSNKN